MKKIRNELKDLKQFGIMLGAILAIFGLVQFFKGRTLWYPWFFGFSLFIFCIALIIPMALKGVYSVFIKIAHWIGRFNTAVILILIYFVVITPIACVLKILGKDLLNRKIDKKIKSYWDNRVVIKSSKQQLEKQF